MPGHRAKPERALLLRLAAFDWNCPPHIKPRFSEAELADALAPLRQRLQQLESENMALRGTRDDSRMNVENTDRQTLPPFSMKTAFQKARLAEEA